MESKEREKIMEKRSSLRSWQERKGKTPDKGALIGGAFLALIIILLIASSFLPSTGSDDIVSPAPVKTPSPTLKPAPLVTTSIPAPSIKITSPENITYSTSTPPLNFIVAGSSLSTVFLSVDGGPNITVPHDGTLAKIDFAGLSPLFIDDFSKTTKGSWTDSNSWSVADGKYITNGGSSTFGDPEWSDYIIETKIKIVSGKDVSIDFRWDGGSNNYRLQTTDPYESLALQKMDDKGYTTLSSAKLTGIDPAGWHTWKIIAIGNKIQAFIDDVQYIDYTDNDKPYLKGNLRLRVLNSNVEYDHVQVYKPLPEGEHDLTIQASNNANKSVSQSVHFTVIKEKETVGKIGLPFVKYGLEVTVKTVNVGELQTSVWLSVKNRENEDKPFKLSPGPAILDNTENQYESVKVARSAEITQTTLYSNATKEGAVFFERFKAGASPKKLILYINGDKFEFILERK